MLYSTGYFKGNLSAPIKGSLTTLTLTLTLTLTPTLTPTLTHTGREADRRGASARRGRHRAPDALGGPGAAWAAAWQLLHG